jgi:hypothetical protein
MHGNNTRISLSSYLGLRLAKHYLKNLFSFYKVKEQKSRKQEGRGRERRREGIFIGGRGRIRERG